MRYLSRVLLLATAVVCLTAAHASAQFADSKKGHTILRIGYLLPGTVTASPSGSDTEYDFDTDGAVVVGIAFEHKFSGYGVVEFALDIYALKAQGEILDIPYKESALLLNPSVALKLQWLNKRRNLAVRPGGAVGLGLLESIREVDETHHLTVRLFVEGVLFSSRGIGLALELGLFIAPTGGNSDVDSHSNAMPLVRFGLML